MSRSAIEAAIELWCLCGCCCWLGCGFWWNGHSGGIWLWTSMNDKEEFNQLLFRGMVMLDYPPSPYLLLPPPYTCMMHQLRCTEDFSQGWLRVPFWQKITNTPPPSDMHLPFGPELVPPIKNVEINPLIWIVYFKGFHPTLPHVGHRHIQGRRNECNFKWYG